MSAIKLKDVLISEEASVKEAMRSIDYSGLRVAYVTDEAGRLTGAVSDSEIRKAIIKGHDIGNPVKAIIYKSPVVLWETELKDPIVIKMKIKELLDKMPGSDYIIVLDINGRPKELLPVPELLDQPTSLSAQKINHNCVLVVGGAGYLGSVLVRKLLRKGYKVKVLDLLLFGKQPLKEVSSHDNFDLIEGDMRHIPTIVKALTDVNAVINLAAIVGDPACNNRPEAAIETNYLANKILAEACKYNQVNRFIYASTCSVYGQMKNSDYLTEESPLNPVSLYARSKIHSEIGILNLEDENFSPTILRMSTLYGYSPRMRFDLVLNAMTKTAVTAKKIMVNGGGRQWRPLLNVCDAAEAYIKCLEAPIKTIKGQIYNVGSSRHNYQIIDIAQEVKRCIPEAEIVVHGDAKDARDYSVSFKKIEDQLNYQVGSCPEDSIAEIKKAIDVGEISNVEDPKYYNQEDNR